MGRSKKNTFRALKERLDNKLSRWKEKVLSQAGKEILIKIVAQAIPAYTMSVFKLPDNFYDEMTSMVPSPHSFSCFVQRAFHLYFNKPYSLAHSGGSLPVLKAHRFLSSFLQMTTLFFVKPPRRNAIILSKSWKLMRKYPAKKSTMRRPFYFSTKTPHKTSRKR